LSRQHLADSCIHLFDETRIRLRPFFSLTEKSTFCHLETMPLCDGL
jgi:hypothetical protein